MSTKAELIAMIEERDAKIRHLEEGINKISRTDVVRVVLPWAPHNLTKAQAPYITGANFHDPHRFQALVMQPLVAMLRERGMVNTGKEAFNYRPAGELSLTSDGGRSGHGETVLINRDAAEIVAALIDQVSQFGRDCFTAGHQAGSDILGRLVEGEITADQFDESRQLEIAKAKQNELQTVQAKLGRSIADLASDRAKQAAREAAREAKSAPD